MRTVVPAQITTVEDKLSGNFTVRQFAILMMPAIISMSVVLVAPPYSSMTWYKWLIIAVVSLLLVPLIIRVKGKIILDWVGIYARYLTRPKYYVYDKNTTYLRDTLTVETKVKSEVKIEQQRDLFKVKHLSEAEKNRLLGLLEDGKIQLQYRVNRKGQIDVIATEN